MKLFARQGDLVISKATAPTGEMETVKNYVFAGDSSGHAHTLEGSAKISRNGQMTTVVIDRAANLVHGKPDGHKSISLPAGAYEIRPLRERGGAEDRAVED